MESVCLSMTDKAKYWESPNAHHQEEECGDGHILAVGYMAGERITEKDNSDSHILPDEKKMMQKLSTSEATPTVKIRNQQEPVIGSVREWLSWARLGTRRKLSAMLKLLCVFMWLVHE